MIKDAQELDDLLTRPPQEVVDLLQRTSGSFAVLGAGGKMGFHISGMLQRALAAAGRDERVRTVSRFGSPIVREQFTSAGFEVVSADMSDPAQVADLPDADHVFYLAGIKFGTTNQPELLHRMNVEMPQLIAERYQNSQIVALSTGCVYDFVDVASGGSTEDSATNPPGEYAQSCLGREQAFVRGSQKWGTKSCLIRLNYSVELRYGVLVDIAAKVLSGQNLVVDTGYVNVIWQGDAVEHIIRSLEQVASPPQVLNVTGPETLSVREIALAFADRFDRAPKFSGTESPTAWLNNASRSHALFGLPRISLKTMIDWIADWQKRGGPTLDKPTKFEVRGGDY